MDKYKIFAVKWNSREQQTLQYSNFFGFELQNRLIWIYKINIIAIEIQTEHYNTGIP